MTKARQLIEAVTSGRDPARVVEARLGEVSSKTAASVKKLLKANHELSPEQAQLAVEVYQEISTRDAFIDRINNEPEFGDFTTNQLRKVYSTLFQEMSPTSLAGGGEEDEPEADPEEPEEVAEASLEPIYVPGHVVEGEPRRLRAEWSGDAGMSRAKQLIEQAVRGSVPDEERSGRDMNKGRQRVDEALAVGSEARQLVSDIETLAENYDNLGVNIEMQPGGGDMELAGQLRQIDQIKNLLQRAASLGRSLAGNLTRQYRN